MVVYWDLAPLLSIMTAMNVTKDMMETTITNVKAKGMMGVMVYNVMEKEDKYNVMECGRVNKEIVMWWRRPRARKMGTMMEHLESVIFKYTSIYLKLKVVSRSLCISNGSVG